MRQQDSVATGGVPVVRLSRDDLPANPKRVIRTFASDMAILKGQPPPAAPPQPAAPKSSAPKPVQPPPQMPPMQVSEPHLPPLKKPAAMYVRRLESRPPPLPTPSAVPEGIVHETEPSFLTKLVRSLFGHRTSSPAAMPMYIPQTPTPPVPLPVAPPTPQPHVEAPISEVVPSATAEQEAAERAAVLARLKARVSTYESKAPPPPVFPTPPPSLMRPRSAPPAFSVPGAPEPSPEPERLRTWSQDFEGEAQARGASAFSVLAAQADAPRTEATVVETRKTTHGLVYAIASVVLVVGGSLVLYFSYNFFAARAPVSVLSTAPTGLITPDDSASLQGAGAPLLSAITNAVNSGIPSGNIRLLYLSVSSSTPTGTTTLTLGGTELFRALMLPAPSILARNLSEGSSVGIVHAGEETRAFFILSTSAYERVFAGMLAWEPTMAQDLSALYPSYGFLTGNSTTTPVAPPAAPRFVDETVQSHDVRALKDSQNRTILLYGFRDQNTLIIARDETAFAVLLARLSASK